jgi:hypothetical protein
MILLFTLVWWELLILFFLRKEYGHAEFQPGEEEKQTPISAGGAAAPAKTEAAHAHEQPHTESESADGFTWMQKGLFFAVIVGIVVAYLRMNKRRASRYTEKSLA